MGRRARGDGSVFYDDARGCWVGTLDIGRDPETRRRRRRKVSARDQDRSRARLDELREEYRKTGTVARRDITVRAVVGDFLHHPPAGVRSDITGRSTMTPRRASATVHAASAASAPLRWPG